MTKTTKTKEVKAKMKPAQDGSENSKGARRGKDSWQIPVSKIIVDEHFNKREENNYGDMDELVGLIRSQGQLVPGRAYEDKTTGMWHLNFGHRRLRALQILSKEEGVERTMDLMRGAKDKIGRLIEQYLENVQQKPTDYSRAKIIEGLMEGDGDVEGLSPEEVMEKLRVSQAQFYYLKNLLTLPQQLQDAVKNEELSGSTATKINKKLRGQQKEIAAAVKEAKDNAAKEGKSKATDRHVTTVAGARSMLTIVKEVIEALETKSKKARLDRNETFALALFGKLRDKATNGSIMTLIRNGTK